MKSAYTQKVYISVYIFINTKLAEMADLGNRLLAIKDAGGNVLKTCGACKVNGASKTYGRHWQAHWKKHYPGLSPYGIVTVILGTE